tara:strand:+ start:65 stop:586 length:522 start_codon:yes stop_codon:yes gene_type:complete
MRNLILSKYIQKPIEQEVLFYQGKIKIDAEYFIKKIEEGIMHKENKNYVTNVKGKMTDWKYFLEDKHFIELVTSIFKSANVMHKKLPSCRLSDAWGIKLQPSDHTEIHNHKPCLYSGAIYLTSSNNHLEFPEINVAMKPEVGEFALFSSFLKHFAAKGNDTNIKYGLSFNLTT